MSLFYLSSSVYVFKIWINISIYWVNWNFQIIKLLSKELESFGVVKSFQLFRTKTSYRFSFAEAMQVFLNILQTTTANILFILKRY